ncbi:MAG: ABC transporter permease subunit [Candidatus Saccharibacteria bacterium]|nr:ABC transporter permease subunit [Candidatus Saccharibacteria bacterium]
MIPIIKKELRDKRTSLMFYIVLAIALTWVYIVLFPTVRDQADSLNKLVEMYPEALKKAFKLEGGGFNTIESFLSYELFSLMWPLLAIMLALSRAGSAIAGEVERNTIGTLLSQPISRARIYIAKLLSGHISIVLFVVASILSPIPLAWLYGFPVHPRNFLVCAVLCLCFASAVYSVGLLGSAIASERSKLYGVVGGSILLMYILNVVSGINPSLEKLQYGSIFHYFNATDVMLHARLPIGSCLLFIGISVACAVAGAIIFTRRDISV